MSTQLIGNNQGNLDPLFEVEKLQAENAKLKQTVIALTNYIVEIDPTFLKSVEEEALKL